MNTDKSAASAETELGSCWIADFDQGAKTTSIADWQDNGERARGRMRSWSPDAGALARVSHELRAPLDTILILADRLERKLTASEREAVATIKSAGTDLLELVNDILDLARIESGAMRINRGCMPVADLVRTIERTFQCVAEERGLGFSVRIAPSFPASIECDGKRLVQILRNLLANAFKFTHAGRVELAIGLREDGRLAAFDVVDTGIGIPVEKQKIIFAPFVQADSSTARRYGGTGLGLSISAELARLLGGEIEIYSAPQRGSRFTLLLPLS